MSGRRPILVALLIGACAALIGLSLFTSHTGWNNDPITDARISDDRTRLMIWTENGYNHHSCTETRIDIDPVGDVWHLSVEVRSTSDFCELDLPITEDWHDAWVDFDAPIRGGVTVSW